MLYMDPSVLGRMVDVLWNQEWWTPVAGICPRSRPALTINLSARGSALSTVKGPEQLPITLYASCCVPSTTSLSCLCNSGFASRSHLVLLDLAVPPIDVEQHRLLLGHGCA